jgi:hypothetical protein
MAGVQCTALAFGDEPHRMLKIIQCFSKCCSCCLQGEYVMTRRFWQPYIGQAVGRGLALYKAAKNAQPLHIHPEDGNCNVC